MENKAQKRRLISELRKMALEMEEVAIFMKEIYGQDFPRAAELEGAAFIAKEWAEGIKEEIIDG